MLTKRLNSVLDMKAVVAAFNQEKALVGAFSVITNLRMDIFEALIFSLPGRLLAMAAAANFANCPKL